MAGTVVAVSRSRRHTFSKPNADRVELIAGIGIEGDAHAGETVKHRSRTQRSPAAPNLRQVHLIAAELIDELRTAGFDVYPGAMGENITTSGVDLLALPTGTILRLGGAAAIRITGLRNPCVQLDRFAPGLMHAVLNHDADGNLVRKAGVMAVVTASGSVGPGDAIVAQLPDEPWVPLAVV